MKYDGTNLEKVLEAHARWFNEIGDEIKDEDRADFSDCNCGGLDLRSAMLWGANMRNCDLRVADLRGANLTRADLTGANLFRAYLQNARLVGAQNVPYIPLGCPDTGSFIAWKKAILCPINDHPADCIDEDGHVREYCVVKLRIPEDAERSTDTSGECRATKAEVLEIQKLDGTVLVDEHNPEMACALSIRDRSFMYFVGQTVSVPKLGEDRYQHFSSGIFFYINRMDAVYYLTDGTDGFGEQKSMGAMKDWIKRVDHYLKVERWEEESDDVS